MWKQYVVAEGDTDFLGLTSGRRHRMCKTISVLYSVFFIVLQILPPEVRADFSSVRTSNILCGQQSAQTERKRDWRLDQSSPSNMESQWELKAKCEGELKQSIKIPTKNLKQLQ